MWVRRQVHQKAPLLWVTNIVIIFALSVTGRPLLGLVRGEIPLSWLGYAISLGLALIVLYLLIHQGKSKIGPGILCAGILAGSLLVLTFHMEPPVEKIHLMLFGILGFTSQVLFSLWKGLAACLAVAGLDETLQLFLPSRVCDIQDVGLNSAAAVAGVLLGFF